MALRLTRSAQTPKSGPKMTCGRYPASMAVVRRMEEFAVSARCSVMANCATLLPMMEKACPPNRVKKVRFHLGAAAKVDSLIINKFLCD